MSNLVDINGNKVLGSNEKPDELGCELVWSLFQATSQQDEDFTKLKVYYGAFGLETRVLTSELTPELKTEVYSEMLTDIGALIEMGKKYKKEKDVTREIMSMAPSPKPSLVE